MEYHWDQRLLKGVEGQASFEVNAKAGVLVFWMKESRGSKGSLEYF